MIENHDLPNTPMFMICDFQATVTLKKPKLQKNILKYEKSRQLKFNKMKFEKESSFFKKTRCLEKI